MKRLALLLLLAAPALAQALTGTPRGAAVLDAPHDEVDLATGRAARTKPAATPIAAAFVGAQALTDTPRGVVVAHDGPVQLGGGRNVANETNVAVLDALHDEVDLAARTKPAATPIAAAFVGAQALTDTPRGVVVAHDGRVQLDGGWNVEGVRTATEIVASETSVAVLDALHDEVVIVDLATGRAVRTKTAATPIAAAFVGGQLYILARDARVLQRVGGGNLDVAADPAFLREFDGKLYVYGRTPGVVQEIANDRVTRELAVAPFASDFEISGGTGYLVFPRDATIRTIDLRGMKAADPIAVGAVPVDLAFAGGGTAITARVLAVADPSAKRIWLTEGRQSTARAVARGFLRGVLGLGLYGNRSSQFPTGVDRVMTRGASWIAYDSSSGTLYRFDRGKSSVIAQGIAPKAFTLTDKGVVFWRDGRLQTGTSVAETVRQ